MVTTLYLIRHGETEGSDAKRYKGSIDVPLSEKGVEQIERLSTYIVQGCSNGLNSSNPPSPPFDKGGPGGFLSAVYCSPLSRALKSAEIIAKPFGIKPAVIPDLRERSFGIWEGMSFDEIREKYPEEFKAWTGNPMKFSPMQGESTLEVRDRVVKALNNILSNHLVQNSSKLFNMVQNGTILNNVEQSLTTLNNIVVVAHGGVNRIMLCHLLGIPLENIFRIEQDFAALNIIEFWDKYPVVKLINYTC
ncbi:MAG: histidine phosphatase family protein [Nitrospirae bacterium]|nr:histidine phosphatase family protein [Nitrospirota bacterium]